MHPQLRPPQDNDAAWLLEALNDTRTNHTLIDLPHPYPANFIDEFWLDDTHPLLQFVWLHQTQAVGYIWFSVDDNDKNAEISFLLHPNFQGQGLGLQQLPILFAPLATHMQQNFGTTNITAHVRPTNLAAQKILTACGFKLVDTATYPTANGKTLLQQWISDLKNTHTAIKGK